MEASRLSSLAILPHAENESGQGLLEYVLLLTMISGVFLLVMNGLDQMRVTEKLMQPISKDFAKTYQFGHPKVEGFEGGQTPKLHPRWVGGENLRIFIWPYVAD